MKQRDWVIDIVRVAAVIIVVSMHWTYARVTAVGGNPVITQAYNGLGWHLATWLLMVMPAFFIAGGFANTLIWDRCVAKGQHYGEFLGLRARRLVTPVIPLLLIVVTLVACCNHVAPGLGKMLGKQAGNVLWFLAAYLCCVMVAPLQVWLHDRIGSLIPVLLLTGLTTGLFYAWHRWPAHIDLTYTMFLVWPACHQLGVIYQRRRWHQLPTWGLVLTAVAASALIVVLVQVKICPPHVIGMRDDMRANLIPASPAMVLLGVAQLAALIWLSRRCAGWAPTTIWQRRITGFTALLMPIYLWHLPTLLVMTGMGLAFPMLLVEPWWQWWLTRPVFFCIGFVILAGIVALAAKWELFMQRFASRTTTLSVTVGALAATAGIFDLWRYSIRVTPRGLLSVAAVLIALPLLTTFRRHQH
ncbi:MAG: acyltransferase family protein [Propionibacteriaceae bacterium]